MEIRELKGLFIWTWAGPVRRASSPRWDDFYPKFIWNLLSQFNQKVCYVSLFDQVVFIINSGRKPSCRINVLILFNWYLKNKTKLIKETFIPPCRTGPPPRVHKENFHLALVGSLQNQVRSHLGGLAHFSYECNI